MRFPFEAQVYPLQLMHSATRVDISSYTSALHHFSNTVRARLECVHFQTISELL